MDDFSQFGMAEPGITDSEMGDPDTWFDKFVELPVGDVKEQNASNDITGQDAWGQHDHSDLAVMMMSLDEERSHLHPQPSTSWEKECGGPNGPSLFRLVRTFILVGMYNH